MGCGDDGLEEMNDWCWVLEMRRFVGSVDKSRFTCCIKAFCSEACVRACYYVEEHVTSIHSDSCASHAAGLAVGVK
jgi:hypothetical protein